jgi:hypothetical protein
VRNKETPLAGGATAKLDTIPMHYWHNNTFHGPITLRGTSAPSLRSSVEGAPAPLTRPRKTRPCTPGVKNYE